jgi:hypothetical protein
MNAINPLPLPSPAHRLVGAHRRFPLPWEDQPKQSSAGLPGGIDPGLIQAARSGSLEQVVGQLIASGASLATVILAYEIYETGQQATEVLQRMDQLKRLRSAIQQRIDELGALSAFIKRMGDEDNEFPVDWLTMPNSGYLRGFLDTNGEIDRRYPQLRAALEAGVGQAQMAQLLQTTLCLKRDLLLVDGRVEQQAMGSIVVAPRNGFERAQLDAESIEQRKQVLTAQLQETDSTKELLTMQLQQQVQRKQRLITLASNINDADHRARDAVIKNTRG